MRNILVGLLAWGCVVGLFFYFITRLLTFISTAVVTFSITGDVNGTKHFLHIWHLHGYIMVLYRRTPPKFWLLSISYIAALLYPGPHPMLECTYITLSWVTILILSEHGGDNEYVRTSYFTLM